jgi:hypothetical protein
METSNPKRQLINATFFVIGVITTILLTKFGDKIFPNEPTVVKELTDTIKIVHEYRLPEKKEVIESKELTNNKRQHAERLKDDIKYLNDIKREQELVDSTIRSLQNEISEQNALIFKENYNQIIANDKLKTRGYTYRGQSSNFEFTCPQDKTSDYINLKLIFRDKELVGKISCLLVTVYGLEKSDKTKSLSYIFEQAYEAKQGLNIIRLKNYLKKSNVRLSVGYILKSEIDKKYPNFEKIDCNY